MHHQFYMLHWYILYSFLYLQYKFDIMGHNLRLNKKDLPLYNSIHFLHKINKHHDILYLIYKIIIMLTRILRSIRFLILILINHLFLLIYINKIKIRKIYNIKTKSLIITRICLLLIKNINFFCIIFKYFFDFV